MLLHASICYSVRTFACFCIACVFFKISRTHSYFSNCLLTPNTFPLVTCPSLLRHFIAPWLIILTLREKTMISVLCCVHYYFGPHLHMFRRFDWYNSPRSRWVLWPLVVTYKWDKGVGGSRNSIVPLIAARSPYFHFIA